MPQPSVNIYSAPSQSYAYAWRVNGGGVGFLNLVADHKSLLFPSRYPAGLSMIIFPLLFVIVAVHIQVPNIFLHQ